MILPRSQRRRWTISLRVLLLLILAVGAPLGWWAGRSQAQRRAVAAIRGTNGWVTYADEVAERWQGRVPTTSASRVVRTSANQGTYEEPGWRTWLKRNLGPDYVDTVLWATIAAADPRRPLDLVVLADLPALEHLTLALPQAGSAGLRSVAGLRHLQTLSLKGVGIGDVGMAHLAGLADLQDLRIPRQGATMTDAGLRHLRSLRQLRLLEIGSPALTDAGLDHLAGLRELRILYLNNCPGVTDARIANLERQLPDLRVVHLRR